MHWGRFLFWVRDNISLILFFLVVAFCGTGWLIFEAVRSQQSRGEVSRLRHRLYELERQRQFGSDLDKGPVVLPSRWIRVGTAATTSDGGCLLLVDAASPLQNRVMLTVRVDGLAVKRNQPMLVGNTLEVSGKSGLYSIEVRGAGKDQARVNVSLRSHHELAPSVD